MRGHALEARRTLAAVPRSRSIQPDHRGRAIGLLVLALLALSTGPAGALVRFGHNVFVGGHDFSHQTYDRKRRAVIHLYDHQPRNAGCVWHADGHGGRVKICHLRTIR